MYTSDSGLCNGTRGELDCFYHAAEDMVGRSNGGDVSALFLALVTSTFLKPKNTPPIPSQLDGSKYDFIIVGAGSAGCVVANRLSEESSWKILLLEAGGEESPIVDVPAYTSYIQSSKSPILWHITTQPEPSICNGKGCSWPVGKVLGGSSTINSLIYARGFKRDYDRWAELGNTGWDWKTVLHYFKKSENNLDPDIAEDTEYHSTGGYLAVQRFPYQDQNINIVVEAYNELGYPETDQNGGNPTGIFVLQGNVKNGVKQSANKAFLEPVRRHRKNLDIVTNILVNKVLIDEDQNIATGVQYMSEDGRTTGFVYARKEVIICAGALLSPHLLMHSGIGPKEILKPLGISVIKDLRVGYNLMNHATSYGITLNLTRSSTVPKNAEEWLADIEEYVKEFSGPLSATGSSQLSGYWNSSFATADHPDIKYNFALNAAEQGAEDYPASYYSKMTITPYLVQPLSKGYLTIASNKFKDMPNIITNSGREQQDRDRLVEGHMFAVKIANTRVFTKYGFEIDDTPIPGCENHVFGTKEYFYCMLNQNIGTAHHHSGTCKMGPKWDPDAVVSPELIVHGLKNLRVVDTSITPIVPSANTHAPAVMIGEKASDMIRKFWGKE